MPFLRPPEGRVWGALLWGAAAGIVVATAALWVWSFLADGPRDDRAPEQVRARVTAFRSAPAPGREVWLVPAGPDGTGDPALAAALFPTPAPRRALVAAIVANTGAAVPPTPLVADFAAVPLRASGRDGAWFDVATVASLRATGACAAPAAADEIRLRGAGGTETAVSVPQGTLRQVLFALPEGVDASDLTGVQWGAQAGAQTFTRTELGIEDLRGIRLDPAPPPRAR